ncbi:MAG: hypothetical protein R2910_02495 [Gemmatimonadales bacterium]
MSAPTMKDAAWAFTPAEPPPARVAADIRQTNNDAALPGFEAREIATRAAISAEQVAANEHLSEAGKAAEFTRLSLPDLAVLHRHRAALDAAATVVQRDAAALEATVSAPKLSDPELARQLAVAQRFATLSPAERTAWVGEAMNGTSPVKLAALANEDPAITGLAPEQHARLQRILRAVQVDTAAQARLAARAELIAESALAVERTIAAIEDAADQGMLKEKGLTTLRRRDMSDAEKADYIDTHGLAAFKALR